YTGLRPGEKLYEELLIDTRDQPTSHPLIRRASEPNPSDHHLLPLLNELEDALSRWDDKHTSELLVRLVPEYNRDIRLQGSV
ncbi:MAG: polysaccharide biosynthesis protein, partial [Cyanobacteriota bacterium]